VSISVRRFSPERMKQARLKSGFTHSDLARETGKSETNVGRWERGQHEPRGESVVAIARATGHDIEFFYIDGDGGEDEEDAEAAMRRVAADMLLNGTDLERDLLKLVRLVRGDIG
jgi:transcriptional regulator with XRE-family HTH domain